MDVLLELVKIRFKYAVKDNLYQCAKIQKEPFYSYLIKQLILLCNECDKKHDKSFIQKTIRCIKFGWHPGFENPNNYKMNTTMKDISKMPKLAQIAIYH